MAHQKKVYIEPPTGLRQKLKPESVLKLNKALYGLKQAPRSQNKTFVSFLTNSKFRQLQTDNCIFYNETLIIAIYVDDTIIIGKNEDEIKYFKSHISNKFKTKDLGRLHLILGLQIENFNSDIVKIHQKNYIVKLIKIFKLQYTKNNDIPLQPNLKLTAELINENEQLRNLIDAKKNTEKQQVA